MYYVSTKGGGRGSAICLLLLTWGEGGLRGHAYVIILIFFALDKTKNPQESFKNDKKVPKNLKIL